MKLFQKTLSLSALGLILFNFIPCNLGFLHNDANAEDKGNVISNNQSTIGVLDMSKIINATAYTEILAQIDKESTVHKKWFEEKEQRLKKKDQDIESTKNVSSKEELQKKQHELDNERKAFYEKAMFERHKIQKAFDDAVKIFMDEVLRIVKEKSIATNRQIVLDRNVTYYLNDSLDISNEILMELNKKVPNIKVKFETTAALPDQATQATQATQVAQPKVAATQAVKSK